MCTVVCCGWCRGGVGIAIQTTVGAGIIGSYVFWEDAATRFALAGIGFGSIEKVLKYSIVGRKACYEDRINAAIVLNTVFWQVNGFGACGKRITPFFEIHLAQKYKHISPYEAIKHQPYKQINLFIWLVYRLLRDFTSQYSSSLKSTTYIDYQLVMCRCMTVGKTNYAIWDYLRRLAKHLAKQTNWRTNILLPLEDCVAYSDKHKKNNIKLGRHVVLNLSDEIKMWWWIYRCHKRDMSSVPVMTSIFEKAKSFLPRSFREWPMWYTSSSIIKNRSWALVQLCKVTPGYWALCLSTSCRSWREIWPS